MENKLTLQNVETEPGGRTFRIVQFEVAGKKILAERVEDYVKAHREIKRHNKEQRQWKLLRHG